MHKIFLILFVLMFSDFCFSQGDSPALLRGQAQTSNSVGAFIRTPNSQVTRLNSSTALLETGNTNILVNPNFAHSSYLTGWSTTGDTSTKSEETSVVISGTKSAAFVASAQAINLSQSSTLYAAQFADGVQGIAMCRIKSGVALNLCSISAGTVSTTNCVAVNADSKWGLYKVPFILGATSNGVSVASSGNVTGTAYVDDCFVGAVDLKVDEATIETQTFSQVTPTLLSTTGDIRFPTAGATTSGDKCFTYDQSNGRWTMIRRCKFTMDVGLTLTATGSVFDIFVDGVQVQKSNTTSGGSVRAFSSFTRVLNPAQYVTINTGATVVQSASLLNVVATTFSNVSTYTASCGANCEDVLSFKISTAGVVSDETQDFINGNCAITSTSIYTCTFNSGIFTVAPICQVAVAAGGTILGLVNNAGTTSSQVQVESRVPSTGTNAVAALNVTCQKTGADFKATRNIIGSFNEVMTTPGVSKIKECFFAYGGAGSLLSQTTCTSASCTEYFDSCLTATLSRAAAGDYSIAFSAGTWAANSFVTCQCHSNQGGVNDCQAYSTSASGADGSKGHGLFVTSITGTGRDGIVVGSCTGVAP